MPDWKKVIVAGCGAFGGLIAIIADLSQKGDASAVLKISSVVNRIFEIGISTPVWVVILVICSATLCVIFEPDTKPKGFFMGASILALLMTGVPYVAPSPLPPGAEVHSSGAMNDKSIDSPAVRPAKFSDFVERPLLIPAAGQVADIASPVDIRVVLHLPQQAAKGGPFPVTLTFFDPKSGEKWQVLQYVTTQNFIVGIFEATLTYSIPSPPDRLFLRVEAAPLETIEAEAEKKPSDSPKRGSSVVYDFNLNVDYSTAPAWIKNLFGVRKF